MGLLRRELVLLPERKPRLELFFDFWVAGVGHGRIRQRIRAALQRYRDTILPFAEDAVAESPNRFSKMRGKDLAGLVAVLLEGYVVQAIVDPTGFDVEQVLSSVAALVGVKSSARSASA